MAKSIVGIAPTSNQVEFALEDLQSDGLIPSSDISVLMPDSGVCRTQKLHRGYEPLKRPRLLKEQQPVL